MYIMIADERFEWNHTASALQVHCRRGENDCWSEKKRSVSIENANSALNLHLRLRLRFTFCFTHDEIGMFMEI